MSLSRKKKSVISYKKEAEEAILKKRIENAYKELGGTLDLDTMQKENPTLFKTLLGLEPFFVKMLINSPNYGFSDYLLEGSEESISSDSSENSSEKSDSDSESDFSEEENHLENNDNNNNNGNSFIYIPKSPRRPVTPKLNTMGGEETEKNISLLPLVTIFNCYNRVGDRALSHSAPNNMLSSNDEEQKELEQQRQTLGELKKIIKKEKEVVQEEIENKIEKTIFNPELELGHPPKYRLFLTPQQERQKQELGKQIRKNPYGVIDENKEKPFFDKQLKLYAKVERQIEEEERARIEKKERARILKKLTAPIDEKNKKKKDQEESSKNQRYSPFI